MRERMFVFRAAAMAVALAAGTATAGEELLLTGWRFHQGVVEGAEKSAFDDSAWENVRIPHDWAIKGPFARTHDLQRVAVVQDGDKVPVASTGRTGGLPWLGQGWYRRTIVLPKEAGHAELVFDGAMAEPCVYVDGREVAYWACGYNSFVVDVSDFIGTTPDGRHTLAVQLDNQPESSRWYPGAGLYRPVRLRLAAATGLVTWGTCLRTESLTEHRAKVSFSSEVRRPEKDTTVTWRLLDAAGRAVASVTASVGADGLAKGAADVAAPQAWTPETPHLYVFETTVRNGDAVLETQCEKVGLRTVSVGPDGFKLNGVRRDFRGACLHHDLGPLGAAFNKSAFRRQVRLLKEAGCDSIRTSHNMPPPWQTEICDEMGMMVMAESFDMWLGPKCRNGYCRFFEGWWQKDLTNLLRCHRNRPSVVMWSIGNEVPDQSDREALDVCRQLQDFCHRLDPTRPVTQGLDRLRDAIDNGFVRTMEVPGLNYRLSFYDEAWTNSTHGIVLGSETASTVSSRGVYKFPVTDRKDQTYDDGQLSSYDLTSCSWSNLPDEDWALQEDRPWTIGEFVWTGIDYLGEPTPYKEYWPSRSSYFGFYDLAGLPKDRFWLYRSHWNKASPTLHVLPHWTWPGREGQVTPVYVYTSYPEAELFVNGRSQGRRRFDKASRLDRFRLRWNDVVYQPGELRVVAYGAAGQAVAEKIVRTAGSPHHLEVSPDRTRLLPLSDQDTPDLAFVTVRIVDRDGNLCPDADVRINFAAEGAVGFKAVCNGDATSLEMFHHPTMKAFHGELVAVVEPSSVGDGRLVVKADSLPDAACGFFVGDVQVRECPTCEHRLQVVLPDAPTTSERFAAKELSYHLGKATETTVPVVAESACSPEGRRFYVGRVKGLEALGVDAAAFEPEERLVRGCGRDAYFVGGEIPNFEKIRQGDDWETWGYGAGGTLYAVYDFLVNEMGVAWLWPGELGEVIPRRAVPDLANVSRRGQEPLVERCLRGDLEMMRRITIANRLWGWKDAENAHREVAARRLWLTRHRIGKRRQFYFGHAFTGWPERFKDHPEYFALQPNGRRGHFVTGAEGDDKYYPLCVSNPEVQDLIVGSWARSNRDRFRPGVLPPYINCCENDSPGFCVCANCRAWDAPDPRFATHPYWNGTIKDVHGRNRFFMGKAQLGETGEAIEGTEPPYVTDRYVKFYNAVLERARKVHPLAGVCAYAYSNYSKPPKETHVSDGVVLAFVPEIMFPYAAAEQETFRRNWGGWNKMGATQMRYRPNYMFAGASLPYSSARRIAEDMNFAFAHGMIAVDQDSLLGAWSAQALKSYVAARILREPDATFDKMSGEFLAAFGAGAEGVRRYCEMLEALNDKYTEKEWGKVKRANRTKGGSPGGGHRGFVLTVSDVYSEAWFAEADALLKAADAAATGTEHARVAFLRKGLRDGLLTYRTRVAQKSGDEAAFKKAFQTLTDYRASVEADLVCAFAYFADQEWELAGWPHETQKYWKK